MSEFIMVKTTTPGDSSEDLAVPSDIAGASVSWTLNGAGVLYDDVTTALSEAEFDQSFLPEEASPASALLHMLTKLYRRSDTLVKSVPYKNYPKGISGAMKAVYAVVPQESDDSDEKLRFSEAFKVGVRMVQVGDGPNSYLDPRLWFGPEVTQDQIETMEDDYPNYLKLLGSSEQSLWLTRLAKNVLGGVPLEGGSGHYFIEPSKVPVWRNLHKVLGGVGIFLHEIPAMRSTQAVEAVLSSLRVHVNKSLEELEEEVKKYIKKQNDGSQRKIQDRVIQDRQKRTLKDLELIERYEKLFSCRLEDLRAQIEKVQMSYAELATIAG